MYFSQSITPFDTITNIRNSGYDKMRFIETCRLVFPDMPCHIALSIFYGTRKIYPLLDKDGNFGVH